MLYAELLEKSKSYTCCSGWHEVALEAVMELHQPFTRQSPYAICITCQLLYPCPTIQAIEKKLQ